MIGTCTYCGQIAGDLPLELETQEEADRWATDRCDCTQATLARRLRERIREAQRRVGELFGTECERFGFEPVEGEIVDALNTLAELAARGTISKAAVQTCDHGKASVCVSTKGTIKVARIEARACQLEV